MSGFERQTLYAAVAATGYRMDFTGGKWFASVTASGGTFWVRTFAPGEKLTAPVALPGAPGTVVVGWLRLPDGITTAIGVDARSSVDEDSGATGAAEKRDQIAGLVIWAEGGGDLLAVAH